MKTGTNPAGQRYILPETEAEIAALEDLRRHRPIFAVAEESQIAAFIRGYEMAMAKMNFGAVNINQGHINEHQSVRAGS